MAGPTMAQSESQARLGPPDSVTFERVVRHIVDQPSPAPVRVDPRAMSSSPRTIGPASRYLADVDPGKMAARRRVLKRLGIPSTNALDDEECYGALAYALSDSAERAELSKERCPSERFTSVMVGTPRAGGSCWPGIRRISNDLKAPCEQRSEEEIRATGKWTVRVAQTNLGPQGSTGTVSDYEFVYESGKKGWTLAATVRLTWSD